MYHICVRDQVPSHYILVYSLWVMKLFRKVKLCRVHWWTAGRAIQRYYFVNDVRRTICDLCVTHKYLNRTARCTFTHLTVAYFNPFTFLMSILKFRLDCECSDDGCEAWKQECDPCIVRDSKRTTLLYAVGRIMYP